MTTISEIGNAPYIALESFKKDGQGVITPVWVTQEGGRLYVMTDANAWKVKRIRRNGRVRLARSSAGGKPLSAWLEAQARVLDSAEAWPPMERRMKAKYGIQYRLLAWWGRVRGQTRQPVVIEIQVRDEKGEA